MSKKKKKSAPVQMPKKESNVIFHIDSITATKMCMPKYTPGFKTGAHKTAKDRPRDKSWKRLDSDQ